MGIQHDFEIGPVENRFPNISSGVGGTNQDNKRPSAEGGLNRLEAPLTTVQLDGGRSHDPNGDPLTFLWQSPPEIILSDPTIPNPTFFAPSDDVTRRYTFTLTVTDPSGASDSADVKITALRMYSVNENGTDDTFGIRLTSQPQHDVTATFAVSKGAILLSATNGDPVKSHFDLRRDKLERKTGIYDTAVDDSVDNAEDPRHATIANVFRSQDPNYNERLLIPDLKVRITDDDTAGLDLSETDGSAAENGGGSEFNVRPLSRPTGEVTVRVSSSDTRVATVAPEVLEFTAADWDGER